MSTVARIAYLLLGLAAAAVLAVQLDLNMARRGGLEPALWSMSRFFTLWTMAALSLVALWAASQARPQTGAAATALGAVTLYAIAVGLSYHLLLAERHNPTGLWARTNLMLHYGLPGAAALLWLLLAPKGRLSPRAPLLWLAFPAAYLAVVLARGEATGRYPYFFLDAGRLGYAQVALHAAALAALLALAGLGLYAVDRLLAARAARPRRGAPA